MGSDTAAAAAGEGAKIDAYDRAADEDLPLGPGRYAPLIETGQEAPPEPDDHGPEEHELSSHVFDEGAYKALEMDLVYETLDTAKTTLGRCALQRVLASPHRDPKAVRARQEALLEIEGSSLLRDRLQELVDGTKKNEEKFYDLLWADFVGMLSFDSGGERPRAGFGYEAFKHARAMFKRMFAYGENPPAIKSDFLRSLLDDFGRLGDSRFYKLLTRGLVSESGPVAPEERRWYWPAYRFRPTPFKPLLLGVVAAVIWIGLQYFAFIFGGEPITIGPIFSMILLYGSLPLIAVYLMMVGSSERDSFIKPVGQEFLRDGLARKAVDALGEIDLLLTMLDYKDRFPRVMSMPEISEAKHHELMLRDVRSPIFTMGLPDYTENTVVFEKTRLNFITGPNSGGKTALCKTVLQSQALAQAGCFVPATEARVAPADRIFYQVPQPGHMDRAEGRFATELSRTRDIFFGCTPMSLLVLDEPFEGTSFKERLTVSKQVLDGFIRLGSTVLFITHNHELAKTYRKARSAKAQFLATDFEDEKPTYRFKKGIASHSHAEFVAKEIGFSKEDIERRFQESD